MTDHFVSAGSRLLNLLRLYSKPAIPTLQVFQKLFGVWVLAFLGYGTCV